MILKTEELKNVCSKLLSVIDTNDLSQINEWLELKTINNKLELSITNKEYIVKMYLCVNENENLHATIKSEIFLKLIPQITTDTIKLEIENNNLIVVGNGTYTFPMIYNDDELYTLPDIIIEHSTNEFEMLTDSLNNIMIYNTKETMKHDISHPVQKMYYIDNDGCITFSSSACVTDFKLGQNIKFLLNAKVVKLFKLFKTDKIKCTYGYTLLNDGNKQYKIKFENDFVTIIDILNTDENLINMVPTTAIRNRVNDNYDYTVVFNKNLLSQTINRLLVFVEDNQIIQPYGVFEFNQNSVNIYDKNKINNETVNYVENVNLNEYEAAISLLDLKFVLDSCKEENIILKFGNHQAIVLKQSNVSNVIPELII